MSATELQWKKYTISHSQRDEIQLFVQQHKEHVILHITSESAGPIRLLKSDRLLGSINDIRFDQHGAGVPWVPVNRSFEGIPCEFDMMAARNRNGQEGTLDYLKYHIANAINSTITNRSFSRFLKKKLPGEWHDGNFRITFKEDGELFLSGKPTVRLIIQDAPAGSKWSVSSNMLFVADNGRGIRTQIVDIQDDSLVLPGGDGCLFYKLKLKR